MTGTFRTRWATEVDLPALRSLMALAIDSLQAAFLSPEQVVASRAIMGLDTQLVADGTYLVAEKDGRIVGCGGWSRRSTLYGGDHSTSLRNPELLLPLYIACGYATVETVESVVGGIVVPLVRMRKPF